MTFQLVQLSSSSFLLLLCSSVSLSLSLSQQGLSSDLRIFAHPMHWFPCRMVLVFWANSNCMRVKINFSCSIVDCLLRFVTVGSIYDAWVIFQRFIIGRYMSRTFRPLNVLLSQYTVAEKWILCLGFALEMLEIVSMRGRLVCDGGL